MNMAITNTQTTTPDFTAIKQKQQTAWGSGDYSKVGVTLQLSGEALCEAMDLRSGQTVLDVAAGNGNATLAAARRFCAVTSTDYVEHLLDKSRQRANVEGLTVDYQQADAENLPFPNAHFDNVMSTFGVMFAPNQQKCAAELMRVCKPGGKIGLANWTPESFIGQLFKVIGKYIAPPPGLFSPAMWGTEDFLDLHFSQQAEAISVEKKDFNFRYPSPEHFVELFKTYYGPVHKAFLALCDEDAEALESDILSLVGAFNRADDGTMVVPSEYIEVVIKKSANNA